MSRFVRAGGALMAALLCCLPAGAAPAITFEASGVTVSGLTPRGRGVLFSVAREVERYATTVVRREEILADEDGDGTASLALEKEVPFKSVWIAVDLESGESVAAAPAGFPLREAELPPRAIPAALNRLDLERKLVHLLLVRPKTGAWGLRVGDGGASDDDGRADGTLRARLGRFWSVGDTPPPPERLAPGDVLLVIDQETLEHIALRLRSQELGQ